MDTLPHRPAGGRAPRGLLGMVALLVLVESFVAAHDHDFAARIGWEQRLLCRAVRGPALQADILSFGDSLVKSGVVPKIIAARTGKQVYNLSIGGGQAPASYYLLRRALRAGAHPSAVLVDFFPRLLEVGPQHNLHYWPELLSLREGWDLAWTARDADLFSVLVLNRIFPSVQARRVLRDQTLRSLQGDHDSFKTAIQIRVRNHEANRGAVLVRAGLAQPVDLDNWSHGYFPPRWECDPVNAKYLRRFLALAAAHRIPVFWLLPPLKPELQARNEHSGFDARYTRHIRTAAARYPNVTVVDGRRAQYDPAVFFDPHHLGIEGASIYSTDLADILSIAPAGAAPAARWIDLPSYRNRPIGVALEDVDRSAQLVNARRERKRR